MEQILYVIYNSDEQSLDICTEEENGNVLVCFNRFEGKDADIVYQGLIGCEEGEPN